MGFPRKITELPLRTVLKNTDLFVSVDVDTDTTNKVTLESLSSFIGGENQYVTGGTYNEITETIDFVGKDGFPPFSVDVSKLSEDTYVTGGTLNGAILEIDRNNGEPKISIDLSSISGSSTDTFITGTSLNNTIYTINQNDGSSFSTDFESIISGKVDTTLFDTYTADTQTEINSKVDTTLFDTYTADTQTEINSKLDITTFDTYTANTVDNNTFVSGGTYNSGTTSLDFVGNSGFSPFSVSVQPLISPFEVTGTQGAVQPKDSSYTNTTQGTVWLGGTVSKIAGDYNFIGNGINHNIEAVADYSFIGNGNNNHLGDGVNQVVYSAILAGKDNTIEGTVFNSAIIAGENNTITHSNTFILGSNISSTQTGTTYVENLNVGSLGSGISVNNLGIDASGNVVVGSSGTTSTDTYVTGATLNGNTLEIERNNGLSAVTVDLSSLSASTPTIDEVIAAGNQLTNTNNSLEFPLGGNMDWSTSGGQQNFYISNSSAASTYIRIVNKGGELEMDDSMISLASFAGKDLELKTGGNTDDFRIYLGTNGPSVGDVLEVKSLDGNTGLMGWATPNDVFVTSGEADVATQQLTFTNNSGGTFSVTNAAALFSDNDINVTGGTYDNNTGCVTFFTNSGSSFPICGFITGLTDTYTSSGTYDDNTKEITFTRTDATTYSVDLSTINTSFTGNTSGTCINELWVSNISGCSPVTIGTELVVNDDTSINGHLTVTSSGSNTSDTVFLVQDSLGNHIIEALDTGVVHVGDDTVNSPLPTNPTLIIGAGKTPNDRGSLAFTSTGIGIGGDNDGTNDFLLFRLSTNQDSQWRFYNTSSFGWILNDRKTNSFGSQSGLRTTISTARSYGMDFMLDQNDAGVSDTCGFRFSSKDNTIAGANDVERFVIENGASETKSYFDNISVLGVGTSNPNTNVRLHISGDTLINGSLSADTITLSEDPTLNNIGTEVLIRNSSTGNIEYREASTLSGSSGTNTYITGGTLENGTLTLGRNDGAEISVSGFSSGNTVYSTTTNFSAGIPQTITHNLNTPNVIVQTIDTNTSELINGTISNYTNNTLDVTLSSSLNNIKTIVIGNSNSTIINPLFSWNDPVVQSGNTLSTCIDQLFVHSISGCSPVLIGDTQFTNEVSYSPQTVVDLPTYILTNCSNSLNTITTTQNLQEYIGKTITLASEGATRWSVELQPKLEVTSVSDCCFINWDIRDCDTNERWNVVTYKWSGEEYTASTITLEEQEGCFTVSGTCEEPTLLVPINVIESFESCELCNTSLYQIFNCEGLLLGVTNEDLSAFVGGTWTGSTNPLLIEECFTIESGGEEVTIDGPILTNPLIEIDCAECTSEPTLYTLFTCEGEEIGVTAQDLSSVEGGTYSGTTNPILSGICFTIEGGGEEVTFEDTIDTEELIEKECEECTSEEGTTLTIDGESQTTNTDFTAAPFNSGSPGEGWSWILINYSEEGPIEQDVATVFTTEGFFEGNFPEGLTVYKEGGEIYWPAFDLNQIGSFVPGENYQINIDTNSIITSSAAGLEGYFNF